MPDTETLAPEKPAQSDAPEQVLVFEDVSIYFEDHPVLQNVSFEVYRGQTRILLGPAGVGKSVLLKLANGLLKPDAGRIFLFGQDISRLSEDELLHLRGRVGMVFQESALFDSLDVEDNVAYRLEEEHVPAQECADRVLEALRFVELEHTLQKFPAACGAALQLRGPSSASRIYSSTTRPPAVSTRSPQRRSSSW